MFRFQLIQQRNLNVHIVQKYLQAKHIKENMNYMFIKEIKNIFVHIVEKHLL